MGRFGFEDSEAVSIHAPVKGATGSDGTGGGGRRVSIHAPVKGATYKQVEEPVAQAVSIHAPVKGATRWLGRGGPAFLVSIHAPVKGATCKEKTIANGNTVFQSTRP